jgi:hypothetical protein
MVADTKLDEPPKRVEDLPPPQDGDAAVEHSLGHAVATTLGGQNWTTTDSSRRPSADRHSTRGSPGSSLTVWTRPDAVLTYEPTLVRVASRATSAQLVGV